MFIKVQSNNKNLSYLLGNNPNKGVQIDKLRKGHLFSYFSYDKKTKEFYPNYFNIYFKEGRDEVSFPEGEEKVDYNNLTKYNSPYLFLSMINNIFDEMIKVYGKEEDELTEGQIKKKKNIEYYESSNSYYTVEISNLKVEKKAPINIMKRYFDFDINEEEIGNKNYNIKISTYKSFSEIIKFLFIFGNYLSVYSNEIGTYIDDNYLIKLFKISKQLQSPYFINYLLLKNLVTNKKTFNIVKPLLEKGSNILYTFGGNFNERMDKIINKLKENNDISNKNILDIGCGEGKYLFKIVNSVNSYIGIDKDPNNVNYLVEKINKKKIANADVEIDMENFLENEDYASSYYDIIITEVIEHMNKKEAKKFLRQVRDDIKFGKIIITTPNKEFNPYYLLDNNQLREKDHKFEFNKKEFKDFIDDIFIDKNYNKEYFNIGDEINGISTTSGVVVYNN